MRVRRWDRFTPLAAPPEPPEKLDNGWLRVDGRSARVGILEYDNPDGSVRRELVLPEELFDEASLASARMVPVTNTHPAVLLDDVTAKAHQVGSVGEKLRADGDYLIAPLMVTDGATVGAIRGGRSQLSWGYECEIGLPDPALVAKWGQHDGIQRERRYNHLAIVDQARAGDGARLRLDAAGHQVASADEPVVTLDTRPTPTTEPSMKTIRIDGLTFKCDDEHADAIEQAIARSATEAQRKLDAATSAGAVVKKKLDTLHGNVIKVLGRIVKKWDAMKARMMACDECKDSAFGPGKVDDGKGGAVKCDYCDGSGSVRMHDAIKEEPVAEELEALAAELEHPEEEDGLIADPAAKSDLPADVEAAQHKDAMKRLDAAVKAGSDRRTASVQRRINRDTAARVQLETGARKYLGADAKLDGKTADEVKRLVLAKTDPALKLDGKDAAFIATAYEIALARPAPTTDRNDGAGAGSGSGARVDGDDFDVAKAQRTYNDNLKKAQGGK